MDDSNEIVKSWQANAANWICLIDDDALESRVLVTNAAMVTTILHYQPRTMVDIGCGEGWLTRAVRAHGIEAFGIDAVESLVANAIEKGGAHYTVCSYQQLMEGQYPFIGEADAVAINFALLDKETTEKLLAYLGQALKKESLLFIQTLHPLTMAGESDYTSGWKDGSWRGLPGTFTQPYQWYFRTLEDWVRLFTAAGLTLKDLKEPIHPHTKKPASLLFVLSV